MTAIPLSPCPHCAILRGRATDKATWIRINRLLAWALVLSPLAQVALRTDFWRGFWFDMGLLAVHATLSLALFGLPRGQPRWLLWAGLEPQGLSPRGKFLLTGWRIGLAVVYTPFLWLAPFLSLMFGGPFLLLWIFLPLRILKHVSLATDYALRRWGLRSALLRNDVGVLLAIVFAIASTVNVFR